MSWSLSVLNGSDDGVGSGGEDVAETVVDIGEGGFDAESSSMKVEDNREFGVKRCGFGEVESEREIVFRGKQSVFGFNVGVSVESWWRKAGVYELLHGAVTVDVEVGGEISDDFRSGCGIH